MPNKLITKLAVEKILNKLGGIGNNGTVLNIKNVVHYQTSFVHKSYFQDSQKIPGFHPQESNERLEFLGDSFLGSVTADYLIKRFPKEQEGFLTKIRTRLVRSNMLYRFARFLEFGQYILLSNHIDRLTITGSNKGRNNPRLYEDCFESFIGAIIQDFGDEQGHIYAKRFIIKIIEHLIDFSDLILYNENTKDILQRYFQSLKWKNPIYIDLYVSGPSHLKSFGKGVFIQKSCLEQLSKQVQDNVLNYHKQIIESQSNGISDAIIQYSNIKQDETIVLKNNKKNIIKSIS
jgi:ribonuclease-3